MSENIYTLTETILSNLGSGLSKIVQVLIVLVIGWFIATIIRSILKNVLTWIKSDKLLDFEPIKTFVANTKQEIHLPKIFGEVGYLITLLITFSAAGEAADIYVISSVVRNILEYIPNLFVGIVLLLAVLVIANFASKLVDTFTKGAGMEKYSNLLSRVTRIIIIVFGSLIAVEQLRIDISLITNNVTIIVAGIAFGISLATGIAFGYGGRDHAKKYLDKWLN